MTTLSTDIPRRVDSWNWFLTELFGAVPLESVQKTDLHCDGAWYHPGSSESQTDQQLASVRRLCIQARHCIVEGRRIYQPSIHNARKRRQPVSCRTLFVHDVEDRPSSAHQRIPNHGAMTAPGHRLRAHDGRALLDCGCRELIHCLPKLIRLHIVCITPEAGIAPAGVDRIFLRLAQTAERRHVAIREAGLSDALRQRGGIELRIVPRARDRAHVDQLLDAVCLEQLEELVDRPG